MGNVIATWNGPFDAIAQEGQPPLEIGDELEIPEEQAESAHWLVNGEQFTPPDAIVEPATEPTEPVEPEKPAGDTGEEPI